MQNFTMRIQNLPQFTAKVLIYSVVTDTVCIGIEVSNPVSVGYTVYVITNRYLNYRITKLIIVYIELIQRGGGNSIIL